MQAGAGICRRISCFVTAAQAFFVQRQLMSGQAGKSILQLFYAVFYHFILFFFLYFQMDITDLIRSITENFPGIVKPRLFKLHHPISFLLQIRSNYLQNKSLFHMHRNHRHFPSGHLFTAAIRLRASDKYEILPRFHLVYALFII